MKIHLTGITRYLVVLGLAAILLQMSTGCIIFCALLGISPCAPEEPPPPPPRETRPVGDVAVIPEDITLVPGTSDSIVVYLTNKAQFTDDVSFALEGLPQGVSYTISHQDVPPSNIGPATALVRIVAGPAAPSTGPSGITSTARTSSNGEPPDYDIVDATAHFQVKVAQMARQQTLPAVKIGAGAYSSFAILTDGTLWSWGDNYFGQLGDGTKEDRPAPVPVAGLGDVQEVSGGDHFSMTLHGNSTLQSWGSDTSGRLGNGTYQERSSPQQVPNLPPVQQVSAGGGFTLALQNNGTVSSWGYNLTGQLGYGYLPPGDPRHSNNSSSTPLPIPALAGVQQVSAGRLHSVALLNDGTVRTWGFNDWGQLGDGNTYSAREQPGPVVGLSNVQAVAAGGDHTLALLADGTVRAWGRNIKGALGDGTTTDRATPVQVTGLANVQAIAAAQDYSLALLNNGTVWAWGWNENGQLGDGTATDRTTPVQVLGLTDVRAIAAGGIHSLALVGDCGEVWAWGRNKDGQLGDGSTFDRANPAPVIGIGGLGQCNHHNLWLEKFGRGQGRIVSNTGNLDCGDTCYGVFAPNDQVTLTAQPHPGSIFVNWLDDCGGTELQTTVVMDQSRICQAVFQPDFSQGLYGSVSVSTSGPGKVYYERYEASVTECPEDCRRSYLIGAEADLRAVPDEGLVFNGWGNDCASFGNRSNIKVPAFSSTLCTADFTGPAAQSNPIVAAPYTLEVLRAGPSVGIVTGAGIDCGQDCTEAFDPGTNTLVTLTAEDDLNAGALFGSWLGCDQANGNQCTVNVDTSRNVTAFFLLARVSPGVISSSNFELNVGTAGGGGGSISGSGIDCGQDCSESYSAGSQVTLTPQPNVGSAFAGWTGDGDCIDGAVTMDADLTCTGNFSVRDYTLQVGLIGNGEGTVTSADGGVNCESDCSETYRSQTPVTLTAIPAGPSTQFLGWSGTDIDLAITRLEVTPENPVVGTPTTYEIDVANLTFGTATDVTLTTFSAGFDPVSGQSVGPPPDAIVSTYASTQGSCSQPGGVSAPVKCVLGALPGGSIATVTLELVPNTATLPDGLGLPVLTNVAMVSTTGEDIDSTNNTASLDVQVYPTSGFDLAITQMDVEQDPVPVSGSLVYQITVTNLGASQASDVRLMTFSTGTNPSSPGQSSGPSPNGTVISFNSSQGSCTQAGGQSNPVVCNLGSLPAGASANVTLSVRPKDPTLPIGLGKPPFTNIASVYTQASITGPNNDLDLSNNVASVSAHVLPSAGADLAITRMDATPPLGIVGGLLSYYIEVVNNGPGLANSVELMSLYSGPTLPGQIPTQVLDATLVESSTSQGSCTQPGGPSNTIICSLGSLKAGETAWVALTIVPNTPTLPSSLGLPPLTNSAMVFTPGALVGNSPDPNPANNIDSAAIKVLPGQCSGTQSTIEVTLSQDVFCLANFSSGYWLSVNVAGNGNGTIDTSDGSISCWPGCSHLFGVGEAVTLTALPDPGTQFFIWSGDCGGSNPVLTLTLTGDAQCSAHFIDISDDDGSSSSGGGVAEDDDDDGRYVPPG